MKRQKKADKQARKRQKVLDRQAEQREAIAAQQQAQMQAMEAEQARVLAEQQSQRNAMQAQQQARMAELKARGEASRSAARSMQVYAMQRSANQAPTARQTKQPKGRAGARTTNVGLRIGSGSRGTGSGTNLSV